MTTRDALPATIHTARLTLRAPVPADLADIVAMADNPKMLLTTATLPHPFTEADGRAVIAEAGDSDGISAYAITGADDRFMGTVHLKYVAGKPPEIGYWLGEPHWGQGYGGEVVAGLVKSIQHLPGFDIIDARVLESNPASVRVLEKAGFAIIEHTQSVVERHRGKPLVVLRRVAT